MKPYIVISFIMAVCLSLAGCGVGSSFATLEMKAGESSENVQEPIIKMSKQDTKLIDSKKTKSNNKDELADKLLDGQNWRELAQTDKQYLFCNGYQTVNLENLAEFSKNFQNNDPASCIILSMSMVPSVNFVDYEPNRKIKICVYSKYKGEVTKNEITADGIYENSMFFLIKSDRIYLAVPKIDYTRKEFIESYDLKSKLLENGITAGHAKKIAVNINERFDFYISQDNPLNSAGVIIPESITPKQDSNEKAQPVVDGAVKINGKPYYSVCFSGNDKLMDDTYYIDAETGDTAFLVSMVDGIPIPIYDKNQKYYTHAKD